MGQYCPQTSGIDTSSNWHDSVVALFVVVIISRLSPLLGYTTLYITILYLYTSVLFFVCVWNRWSLRFLFANNFCPRARFAKRCKFYSGSPKLDIICYNLNRSTPKTTSSSIFETIDRPTELFGRHLSAGFFLDFQTLSESPSDPDSHGNNMPPLGLRHLCLERALV